MLRAVLAALFAAAFAVNSASAASPLVTVDWLKEHVADSSVLVLDLRPSDDFVAEHVPKAVSAPYPVTWRDSEWRFLPVEALVANLAALGVTEGKSVVLVPAGTDATELGGATSAYWVLKYLGHDDVAILDGGWYAWEADSAAPVAGGESVPAPAAFRSDLRPQIRAKTAEVEDLLGTDTVLVDARSPSQYLGKTKSALVSRAGRIPGAVNMPFSTVFDPVLRRLKDVSDLKPVLPAALSDKDVDIIAYCNTGHWSSIDWFVLHELLGYPNVRLYDGSMAAWTSDPARPIETGEPAD